MTPELRTLLLEGPGPNNPPSKLNVVKYGGSAVILCAWRRHRQELLPDRFPLLGLLGARARAQADTARRGRSIEMRRSASTSSAGSTRSRASCGRPGKPCALRPEKKGPSLRCRRRNFGTGIGTGQSGTLSDEELLLSDDTSGFPRKMVRSVIIKH